MLSNVYPRLKRRQPCRLHSWVCDWRSWNSARSSWDELGQTNILSCTMYLSCRILYKTVLILIPIHCTYIHNKTLYWYLCGYLYFYRYSNIIWLHWSDFWWVEIPWQTGCKDSKKCPIGEFSPLHVHGMTWSFKGVVIISPHLASW